MKVTVLVLTITATLGTASAQAAKVRPLPIPTGAFIVGSDGAGRVVYTTSDGRGATIMDLRTTRRISIEPPLPTAACQVAAGPAGLVSACLSSAMPSIFTRSFSGTQWDQVPADWSEFLDLAGIAPISIGQQWILLVTSGVNHGSHEILLRRDGSETVSSTDPRITPKRIPSLDTSSGLVSLCSPLRRALRSGENDLAGTPWAEFLYAKPWALAGSGAEIGDVEDSLKLRQCGTEKTVIVCRACTATGLTSRLAAWTKGAAGYLRDLRSKRTTKIGIRGRAVSLQLVGAQVLVGADAGTSRGTYGLLRR